MDKQLKEENLKLMRENLELRADANKQFTKEELKALHSIVEVAAESISTEDEPLLDVVYNKIRSLQELYNIRSQKDVFTDTISNH